MIMTHEAAAALMALSEGTETGIAWALLIGCAALALYCWKTGKGYTTDNENQGRTP